jgi:hypothetical protein
VAELEAFFFVFVFFSIPFFNVQLPIIVFIFLILMTFDFFLLWLGASLVYFLCTWVCPLIFNEFRYLEKSLVVLEDSHLLRFIFAGTHRSSVIGRFRTRYS